MVLCAARIGIRYRHSGYSHEGGGSFRRAWALVSYKASRSCVLVRCCSLHPERSVSHRVRVGRYFCRDFVDRFEIPVYWLIGMNSTEASMAGAKRLPSSLVQTDDKFKRAFGHYTVIVQGV